MKKGKPLARKAERRRPVPAGDLDLDATLKKLEHAAPGIRAAVFVMDEGENEYVLSAWNDPARKAGEQFDIRIGEVYPVSMPLIARATDTMKPVYVPDCAVGPSKYLQAAAPLGYGSAFIVPVVAGMQVPAILHLGLEKVDGFTDAVQKRILDVAKAVAKSFPDRSTIIDLE